jgi:hypothetical protein
MRLEHIFDSIKRPYSIHDFNEHLDNHKTKQNKEKESIEQGSRQRQMISKLIVSQMAESNAPK